MKLYLAHIVLTVSCLLNVVYVTDEANVSSAMEVEEQMKIAIFVREVEKQMKIAIHATELEKEKIAVHATEREDFLVRIAPIKNT